MIKDYLRLVIIPFPRLTGLLHCSFRQALNIQELAQNAKPCFPERHYEDWSHSDRKLQYAAELLATPTFASVDAGLGIHKSRTLQSEEKPGYHFHAAQMWQGPQIGVRPCRCQQAIPASVRCQPDSALAEFG